MLASLPPDLLLLAIGAAVAGFVQGVSGFAFGMVAMSVWVWGVDPRVATVMAVFGALVGQVFSAGVARRGLNLALLWPFLLGAAFGVPLGVLALPHVSPMLFKRLLGMALLMCCPAMLWLAHSKQAPRSSRVGDGVAGALGGFMGGMGGITGLAPALWCTLCGYSKDAHRTVMQNFNLLALSAAMLGLVLTGVASVAMWPQMAVVAVSLLLPSLLGGKLFARLSPEAFRRVVLLLLTLSGAAMVLTSLGHGSSHR